MIVHYLNIVYISTLKSCEGSFFTPHVLHHLPVFQVSAGFPGADPEFLKGLEGNWYMYLGVVESIGRGPKMLQFENCNLIEHCDTRNTSNAIK